MITAIGIGAVGVAVVLTLIFLATPMGEFARYMWSCAARWFD